MLSVVPATKVVKVETAKELLTELFIEHPESRLRNETFDGLLFRGVGDARYQLTPSALRSDEASLSNFRTIAKLAGTDSDSASFQHCFEWNILRRYYWFADRNGLALPKIPDEMHRDITCDILFPADDRDRPDFDQWPPKSLEGLLALAQHYGLPTRLLDWTSDPLAALYFASVSVQSCDATATHLAVWSISTEHLDLCRAVNDRKEGPFIVQPGRFGNPNLAAQRGVFTLCRQPLHSIYATPIDRRPLNQIVADILARMNSSEMEIWEQCYSNVDLDKEFFVKHELPISEAPRLLIYCR